MRMTPCDPVSQERGRFRLDGRLSGTCRGLIEVIFAGASSKRSSAAERSTGSRWLALLRRRAASCTTVWLRRIKSRTPCRGLVTARREIATGFKSERESALPQRVVQPFPLRSRLVAFKCPPDPRALRARWRIPKHLHRVFETFGPTPHDDLRCRTRR